MSDLPVPSAVNHNDDQDESISRSSSSTGATHNKLSTNNNRITSPFFIRHQQTLETKIANNQAYDEIHDIQTKHSHVKKTISDERRAISSSNLESSHDLMQSNYYDQTRFVVNHASSPSKLSVARGLLDINVDDYKKKIAPFSTNKKNSDQNQLHSPPFGDTSESIQQGIAQSAGVLLELNKNSSDQTNNCDRLMKRIQKTHERAVIDYFPKDQQDDGDQSNNQHSLSSFSSSDGSASDSSTSTSDAQRSNKFDSESTIPYETLLNDDDDQENNDEHRNVEEQTEKPLTESTTLLNKTHLQTYGTQSTSTTKTAPTERSKCVQSNGYNSHGSSVTTKSSSDNSGSVRTNSGSDNDEESDEEHYNNSTLANNSLSMPIYTRANDSSTKSLNKINDRRYVENSPYSNEKNNCKPNNNRTERGVLNQDEQHLQLPRFKQNLSDDSNETSNKKDNGNLDYSTLPFTSKWSSGTNSSSSSQQHRTLIERPDQASHLNSTRRTTMRTLKKRKQSQQDIIRTESIPGHRGDRDVDELVMFIDGNSSKPTFNTNETKINSLADSNCNKGTSRKKSRKTSKTVQLTQTSSVNQHESIPSHDETFLSSMTTETLNHIDIDQTDQSLQSDKKDLPSSDGHQSNESKKPDSYSSRSDWFEQVSQASIDNNEDENNSQPLTAANKVSTPMNSNIASEPFVIVKNRRRFMKERRQDSHPPFPTAPRFQTISTGSSNVFNHEKGRRPSMPQQEPVRSKISPTKIKTQVASPVKEVISNSTQIQESSIEKTQSPPNLSSHSSTSSLPSLSKRQSKPPPVVFLNKSRNVELDDVSFGFDIDSVTINKSSDEYNKNASLLSTEDKINLDTTGTSTTPQPSTLSNEIIPDAHSENINERFVSPRTTRDPQFYSGPDIRLHNRSYPTGPISSTSNYIDPLLFFQYNQSRYPNYPSPLTYVNYLRAPYISPQAQYVFLPNSAYPATSTTKNELDSDEKTSEDANASSSTDQVQESLLVYAPMSNPSGQIYYNPSTGKTSLVDLKQTVSTMSNIYPTSPAVYSAPIFYPRVPPQAASGQIFPSPTAYFQPISSPSLFIETKIDQQEIDHGNSAYSNANKSYPSNDQLPSTSSDIMSSALQLVYSQQRRNAQTDRFNLDDLTAYLALKWTETVDHYDQGDSRILFIDHHE